MVTYVNIMNEYYAHNEKKMEEECQSWRHECPQPTL